MYCVVYCTPPPSIPQDLPRLREVLRSACELGHREVVWNLLRSGISVNEVLVRQVSCVAPGPSP
jgi:hypothetical protein